MRRARPFVAVVCFVLVCSACDWSQWGATSAHTGRIAQTALTKANVGGLTASNVLHASPTGQVTTVGGVAFVQQDGRLTAVDGTTHDPRWTATLGTSTTGSVPAADPTSNTVFVTDASGASPRLAGFDVSGTRNCDSAAHVCHPVFVADVGSTGGPATPPVVAGGRVYVNGATSVAAFDATGQTGCTTVLGARLCNPLWTQPTGFSAAGVGPALQGSTLYDVVASGGGAALRAYDATTGAPRWDAPIGTAPAVGPSVSDGGTVFVPSANHVAAFPGAGCGAATCAALFSLVQRTGDPAGSFLGGVAFDGASVYATNADGRLYGWPAGGCGASSCQPTLDVVVDAPVGGTTNFRQTPATTAGMVFALGRRVVSGVNHVVATARDDTTGAELASFDLLAPGFGAGLASPSISAGGIVYAPVDAAVFELAPIGTGGPLVGLRSYPLALSPAFSPAVHDYVIPCAAGTNTVTFGLRAVDGGSAGLVLPTATTPSATQIVTVTLAENQAAVVVASGGGATNVLYWVRCLPHDFPKLFVDRHPGNGAPTPGWYLAANVLVAPGESSYAMILDTNGTPVWYEKGAAPISNVTPVATNTLAFMAANVSSGFGVDPNGAFRVEHLGTAQVDTVRTVNAPTDFHEFQRLPNGDTVLLSFPERPGVDLTGLQNFGPNSTIADCVVQEVNPQGALVFQWRGSDHFDAVRESLHPNVVTVNGHSLVDPFHCNSVDVDASGNLLVSARHMDAVFFVNRATGTIVWKLNGTNFNRDGAQLIRLVNDPGFFGQHDARFQPNGHISLFDNHTFTSGSARGVEFALDFGTSRAQAVFQHAAAFNVIATGSFRRSSDGHSVICWGIPFSGGTGYVFTEVDAAGRDLLDVRFGPGDASYRGLKAPVGMYDANVLRAAVH